MTSTGPSVATMGAARVGPDRERRAYSTDARFWISSARWLQRAINAWRAANPGHGGPIEVDGRAGPVTMSAVRDIGPVIPVENYPADQAVTDRVLIAKTFADQLAELPFVPDPAPSTRAEIAAEEGSDRANALAPSRAGSIRPWMWIAGGVGLVLLLVLGGYYVSRRTSSSSSASRGVGRITPIPARGDPKGHITASALGKVRAGRVRVVKRSKKSE